MWAIFRGQRRRWFAAAAAVLLLAAAVVLAVVFTPAPPLSAPTVAFAVAPCQRQPVGQSIAGFVAGLFIGRHSGPRPRRNGSGRARAGTCRPGP